MQNKPEQTISLSHGRLQYLDLKIITSKVFITSDLHLDHEKAIIYTNRPWTNVVDMQHDLIAEINALPDDSTLYIVGDFTTGSKEKHIRPILDKLKKTLKYVFIMGNHDHRLSSLFTEYGEVHLQLEIKVADVKIVLNHFPMHEWNQGQHGAIHVFGHTHGQFKKMGKAIDVGWDAHGRILSMNDVFDLTSAKVIYQPCHNKNNGLFRGEVLGGIKVNRLIRWWRLFKNWVSITF